MLTISIFRGLKNWFSRTSEGDQFVFWIGVGCFLAALPITAVFLIPLLVLDFITLCTWHVSRFLWKHCISRPNQKARERAQFLTSQEKQRVAAEASARAHELARIESKKQQVAASLARARASLAGLIIDLRKQWADWQIVLDNRYPLARINDAIENARSVAESSPHEGVNLLSRLREALIRDGIRAKMMSIYDERATFISATIPRQEFERMMREAEDAATSTDDLVNRLKELHDWLETCSVSVGKKWQEKLRDSKLDRNFTRRGSFMLSTRTVARPFGVLPTMKAPCRSKWSFQVSIRGLKRLTMAAGSLSTPDRFGPLLRLHRSQQKARFDISSRPPCCWAMTWST